MSTIDIRFDREYFFYDPATSEAVIMKVEKIDVLKKTRYSIQFKVQNYIQREGGEWEKIQMEDFNKLGLVLIGEYNPATELKSEAAINVIRKAALEIGCDKFEVEDAAIDDLASLIQDQVECLIEEEEIEEEDESYVENYAKPWGYNDDHYGCTCANFQGEHETECDSRY